jgi:TolB protein
MTANAFHNRRLNSIVHVRLGYLISVLMIISAIACRSFTEPFFFSGPSVAKPERGSEGPWRIAFVVRDRYNLEIYTMNADGTQPKRLTHNPGEDYDPLWSPDGSKILYTSNQEHGHDVFVMNADGSEQINLTNSPKDDMAPSWSPDGKHILFTSERDTDSPYHSDIYKMNADGSGLVRLTNSKWGADYPLWLPDGGHIVYRLDEDVGKYAFYIMDADGNDEIRLTEADYKYYGNTEISPDGTNLLLETTKDLFLLSLEEGGILKLTNHDQLLTEPVWSPNNTQVAFSLRREDENIWDIHLMDADGNGLERLCDQIDNTYSPSYRPDGRRIAFGSSDGVIYLVNPDGSNLVRLTGSGLQGGSPVWSPN